MQKNRKFIKSITSRGWAQTLTKKGHIKFTFPQTGEVVVTGGSASCCRAQKNLLAQVIRIEEGRNSVIIGQEK